MKKDLKTLKYLSPFTLIVCGGFEARSCRAAKLLAEQKTSPQRILVLDYGSEENRKPHEELLESCGALGVPADNVYQVMVTDTQRLESLLAELSKSQSPVVCDITGMSRLLIFSVLGSLWRARVRAVLIYTEAEEYYPKRSAFERFLSSADKFEAFFELSEYEAQEVMYSANCDVEDVPHFQGNHLPNYPLMLVAFLTYKRSRLSAILREYEANIRILIKGVPVRDDLSWRSSVMNIVNYDLIEDNKGSVYDVQTLDWKETCDFLQNLYNEHNNNYRYNFLLAPLGSKMQTVGACYFAIVNPAVRVVTSTPSKLFPEKYSEGWGETFLVDDLPNPERGRGEP